MRKKTERFHMLLTPSEAAALKHMAAIQGISRAKVITDLIRRSAKRRKAWLNLGAGTAG